MRHCHPPPKEISDFRPSEMVSGVNFRVNLQKLDDLLLNLVVVLKPAELKA